MNLDAKSFPPQKLSMRDKTEDWGKQSLDAIISRKSRAASDGRSRRERIRIEQDLFEGIFDENDLRYVTDPFKVEDSFPATPQNMNIIRPKINLLIGEESKRPYSYSVIQTNDESVSMVEDEIKQTIQQFMADVLQTGQEDLTDDQLQQLDEELQKIRAKYQNPAEKLAFHSLNYLKYKLNLPDVFLKAWKDYLINGESIIYNGIRNGMPLAERVDPKYCEYDNDPDVDFIEDGDWFVRRMPMTASAIYDRFYDLMDESDLDRLLEMVQGGVSYKDSSTGSEVNTKSIMYRDRIPSDSFLGEEYGYGLLNVYHGVWRSYKKVGFLVYVDESGEIQEEVVDETYKPDASEEITWDWVVEIWEGYRIGTDLYVGVQPVEYQSVSIDNPNSQKLPYCGIPYKGRSLVNIMKSLQYMYIIIWYRLELALARDKGKVITMDITQIPKSMGVDTNRWLHMLSAMGVNFINPHECFAPGTKVIMFDGTLKSIEDIQIDDLVMGPDGSSRVVHSTHAGRDMMYRLKHRSGAIDQVVNSAHKNYYFEKQYYTDFWKVGLRTAEELIEEEEAKPYKANLRYTKRANNIDLTWNTEVKLDPYLLGLWLGDGNTGRAEIINIDPEVASYLESYAEANGLKFSCTKEKEDSQVLTFRIFKGPGIKNPILELLKEYGIHNNKDIPSDFIYTSRENRLKLLAGLIDTDGHYSKRDNIYTFSQSEDRKHIVEKAAFIARSLGFKCTVNTYGKYHEKYIQDSDNISQCQPTWSLSILDWDIEIPTLVERKQAPISNKRGDKDYSNFKVEVEGFGDYYGISIDGDNLFLLEDFTIVHNSGWDIPGREGGKPSSYNQFSSIDLTMSNVIVQYIDLMNKIEEMIGELSGVTRQREGSITSSELVGNVQRAVQQSSHITEPLFWQINLLKKNFLNQLLDTAKYAWSTSNLKSLHYFLPDSTRVFMEITDDFMFADFDVFVNDPTVEDRNIEMLKSLLQPAMQNGATLSDVAAILTSNNLSDIKNKLQEVEQKRQKMEAQARQEELAVQQEIAANERELKVEELRIKEEDSIRDYNAAIEVAQINIGAKEADSVAKETLEREKLQAQVQSKEVDTRLKEKELQIKQQAANNKTKQ
jgi:hypothetical protein